MYDPNNDTPLPFLTADLEGVSGDLKVRVEDFCVEELPSYAPCGYGTHTYALVEKTGLPTMEVAARIARELGVARRDVGYAGLKDARAVTRQWMSIEHVDPARFAAVNIPRIRILATARHTNKLKPGHLAGNRFIIRLRNLDRPPAEAAALAERIMDVLVRRGVPNYFGQQRFGNRNDTHLLGRAICSEDVDEFFDIFLGRPSPEESARVEAARTLYEAGDYEKALGAWPANCADQRRALRALIKANGNRARAFKSVDKHLRGFFVSAFQSSLFNQCLAVRMPRIDTLLNGDMACKHINGACFTVIDAAVEQPRCDAFEISPTGPLLGHRMYRLTGPAGDIENPILEAAGLTDNHLTTMQRFGGRGGRRTLRFQPRNAALATPVDARGPCLELQFELDAGCYATGVVREITKSN